MGSPLSPVIANYFMETFEVNALATALKNPKCWFRYVDDIFVVWSHGEDELLVHLNSVNPRIQFTMGTEKEGRLPFLDVMSQIGERNPLSASGVYRIPCSCESAYIGLTREAIEIFKHENIINRNQEITMLDPEWKQTAPDFFSADAHVQPPTGVDVSADTDSHGYKYDRPSSGRASHRRKVWKSTSTVTSSPLIMSAADVDETSRRNSIRGRESLHSLIIVKMYIIEL